MDPQTITESDIPDPLAQEFAAYVACEDDCDIVAPAYDMMRDVHGAWLCWTHWRWGKNEWQAREDTRERTPGL